MPTPGECLHGCSRVGADERKRVQWVARILNSGGVTVSNDEVEAACADFNRPDIVRSKYGQSLDFIMNAPRWKESCLVWHGYNTRRGAKAVPA
jgi:hypothetical protein